jgi:hypothetical protein
VHSLSYSPTTSSATHQGLGSHASSPALLVFAPLQAPPVLSNIVPQAHRCWTYGPLGRNQDKSLCHLLLSIDHREIDLGVIYWLVSGPYSAPTPTANRASGARTARTRSCGPFLGAAGPAGGLHAPGASRCGAHRRVAVRACGLAASASLGTAHGSVVCEGP